MVERVQQLVDGASENLDDLLAGENAAIYRNDPVFMLVVDQVQQAARVLLGEEEEED